MRDELTLNGRWKFCPAFDEISADQRWMDPDFDPKNPNVKSISGEHIGWVQPEFSDSGWLDIPVPASWNGAIRDLWSYEGHGWYRRTVRVPKLWEGRRVEFFSEGANYRTVVYVNGERAGEHEGGYTPFAIRVDHLLKFGEENVLAVAVDNLPKPSRAPGRQFGWWNHGGLYRDVSLRVSNRTRIDDVTVVTDVSDTNVDVSVTVVVEADDAGALDGVCELTLTDPTGVPVALADDAASRSVRIEDGRGEVAFQFTLTDAHLWSPDTPNLYALDVTLRNESAPLDVWSHRIGMRTFRVDGTRLLLNGEPIIIKGVNRHEEYPKTGRTHTASLLNTDLDLVEWLGANAIRCHYPNHRELYHRCDERGIMNMVEVPLWQWGRPLVETDDPKALDAAKTQLREIVKTYKNHACVFIWSVSNENLTQPKRSADPNAVELARQTANGNIELVEMAKALDPTRPVVEVSNEWPNDPVHAHTDISAVNVYVGSPKPPLARHMDQPVQRLRAKMQGLREQVPDRPIIAAEYGEWTVLGLMTDYPPGEQFQAAKVTAFWDAFMSEENIIGGFIWCFSDYDVHRRFLWSYEYRLGFGVFDLYRRPKAAAHAVRAQWNQNA